MLSDGYNAEQKTTVECLEQLKAEIEQLKSTAINVERFVALARKYTDIRELTPEIPADIHRQNRDSRAPVTKEKQG